jgi:hypothetical protein
MKKLFTIAIALMMLAVCCISPSAKTILSVDDWVLETINGSYWEIDTYIGEDEDVTVITQYGSAVLSILSDHSFANNTVTKRVTIPEPISTIGEYAFLNASTLEEVNLSASVNIIGVGAFSGTSALRSINLEDASIERLNPYMFLNSGIEEVSLPSTCIKIADNAFAGCGNLQKIVIPSSVTEIGSDSFYGCENLVIYAPYGSYAIEYAIENGIPYEYTDLTKVTFVRGDADGDGSVIIMDATKIQRVLAKYDEDTDGMIELRATLSDEGFGIMDATRIQRWLAQYDDPYRIGESETVWLTPDGSVFTPAGDPAEA